MRGACRSLSCIFPDELHTTSNARPLPFINFSEWLAPNLDLLSASRLIELSCRRARMGRQFCSHLLLLLGPLARAAERRSGCIPRTTPVDLPSLGNSPARFERGGVQRWQHWWDEEKRVDWRIACICIEVGMSCIAINTTP
jgi:hypothetical protein